MTYCADTKTKNVQNALIGDDFQDTSDEKRKRQKEQLFRASICVKERVQGWGVSEGVWASHLVRCTRSC